MHLVTLHDIIRKFSPRVVVLDPVTNLITAGTQIEARAMLTRLIDFLKTEQITSLFTSLTSAGNTEEYTDMAVSSLMDTWLLLRNVETSGERNRVLYLLKSRGMAHSNQIREFVISDQGVSLVDLYRGTGSVLTGSARVAEEARETAANLVRQQIAERRRREFAHERELANAEIAAIQARIESKSAELDQELRQEAEASKVSVRALAEIVARRGGRRNGP